MSSESCTHVLWPQAHLRVRVAMGGTHAWAQCGVFPVRTGCEEQVFHVLGRGQSLGCSLGFEDTPQSILHRVMTGQQAVRHTVADHVHEVLLCVH